MSKIKYPSRKKAEAIMAAHSIPDWLVDHSRETGKNAKAIGRQLNLAHPELDLLM